MKKVFIYSHLLILLLLSNPGFSSDSHDHQHEIEENQDHHNRVILTDDQRKKAGISLARATAGIIQVQRKVYGRLLINPEFVVNLQARFSGKVEAVYRSKGEKVKSGEPLAKIESNESLRSYLVESPLSGIVIERQINPGEQTDNRMLFVVADPTQLIAELTLFSKDLAGVVIGQSVLIKTNTQNYQGTINALIPGSGASITARVLLNTAENTNGIPDQSIEALISLEQQPVAIKVDNKALQEIDGQLAVFVQHGNGYESRAVEIGLSDGQYTEIKHGLKAGDIYVSGNSYLLKADLEKSGAAHEH